MSLYNVLRQPVVTEKTTAMAESGKYAFEVAGDAPKARIKEAVEAAFGVVVLQVNVLSVKGKIKHYGRRPKAQRSWKKAIVTLRPGDKIDLFASA